MDYIYVDKDNIGSIQLKDSSIMTSLRKNKGALLKYGSHAKYPQYFRRYNLDIKENKYITINQKSSTNKILKISTIKDLDKFNEKFCIIIKKNKNKNKSNIKIDCYDELDGWAVLDWDSILKKYGGLFISITKKSLMHFPKNVIKGKIDKRDRWETLPIKGKRYWSWILLPIRGKRYYDWISKSQFLRKGAFVIWNTNTINKCKYIDTIVEDKGWNDKIN